MGPITGPMVGRYICWRSGNPQTATHTSSSMPRTCASARGRLDQSRAAGDPACASRRRHPATYRTSARLRSSGRKPAPQRSAPPTPARHRQRSRRVDSDLGQHHVRGGAHRQFGRDEHTSRDLGDQLALDDRGTEDNPERTWGPRRAAPYRGCPVRSRASSPGLALDAALLC